MQALRQGWLGMSAPRLSNPSLNYPGLHFDDIVLSVKERDFAAERGEEIP
jgi:hypothetical protein